MDAHLVHLADRVVDLARIDVRAPLEPLDIPPLVNGALGGSLRILKDYCSLQQCVLPFSP